MSAAAARTLIKLAYRDHGAAGATRMARSLQQGGHVQLTSLVIPLGNRELVLMNAAGFTWVETRSRQGR